MCACAHRSVRTHKRLKEEGVDAQGVQTLLVERVQAGVHAHRWVRAHRTRKLGLCVCARTCSVFLKKF